MDIKVFCITLAIGFFGGQFFSAVLNWPGYGTVLAIAYVGSKIVWILQNERRPPEAEPDKDDAADQAEA